MLSPLAIFKIIGHHIIIYSKSPNDITKTYFQRLQNQPQQSCSSKWRESKKKKQKTKLWNWLITQPIENKCARICVTEITRTRESQRNRSKASIRTVRVNIQKEKHEQIITITTTTKQQKSREALQLKAKQNLIINHHKSARIHSCTHTHTPKPYRYGWMYVCYVI